jgi:hypothetical protein
VSCYLLLLDASQQTVVAAINSGIKEGISTLKHSPSIIKNWLKENGTTLLAMETIRV